MPARLLTLKQLAFTFRRVFFPSVVLGAATNPAGITPSNTAARNRFYQKSQATFLLFSPAGSVGKLWPHRWSASLFHLQVWYISKCTCLFCDSTTRNIFGEREKSDKCPPRQADDVRPLRAPMIPALRDRHGTATIARGSLHVCVRMGGKKPVLHKLTRHLISLSSCVRAMLAISHRSQQVALTRLMRCATEFRRKSTG